MVAKPSLTSFEELFNLIVSYPIVLFIIENWNEDVEVRQQILKPHCAGERT